MEMIYHQLLINASIETVYQAITTHEGLSSWWISDCTVKAEPGFTNQFRVEGYVNNHMLIKELLPHQRVAWECTQGESEWIGTLISFELSGYQNLCKLDFRHNHWEEMSEFFATCNFHWARHLLMLQELCETGKSPLSKEKELKEVKKVKS